MEDQPSLRLLNWNLQWKRVGSDAGRQLREKILTYQPDIVCLTEAHTDFALDGGYWISSEPDYGYPLKEGRRKVLLWSRQPWTDVDTASASSLPPGRFVSGKTNTPLGALAIFGVCVPWSAAHVSTGRKDRRVWEDHSLYLNELSVLLQTTCGPRVVVGDFNQTMPRSRAPRAVHELLLKSAGSKLSFASSGPIAPLNKLVIDHVLHSAELMHAAVEALSPENAAGDRLTDHVGVLVELRSA
ncbi:endonuclease/exonuclease/phosphatase family protein [Devosia albogilva]|uniref:Endonuclease/exonuclease/phosphatase family protein n=1 Tax=Devosia albogilva TaxID=429726 RepID=A0ABW5QNF9_9HYPH